MARKLDTASVGSRPLTLAALAAAALLLASGAQAAPGRQLAAVTPAGIVLVDDAGGARPVLLARGKFVSLAWSADVALLAAASADGRLTVVHVGSKAPPVVVAGVDSYAWRGLDLYFVRGAGLEHMSLSGRTTVVASREALRAREYVALGVVRGGTAYLLTPSANASAYGGPPEVVALDLGTKRASRIAIAAAVDNVFPAQPGLGPGGRLVFELGSRLGHCEEGDFVLAQVAGGRVRSLFSLPARGGAWPRLLAWTTDGVSVYAAVAAYDTARCLRGRSRQRQRGTVYRWDGSRLRRAPFSGTMLAADRSSGRLAIVDGRVSFPNEHAALEPGPLVTLEPDGSARRRVLPKASFAAWRPSAGA